MPHTNGKALRWDHGLRRKAIVESGFRQTIAVG